MRITGVRHTEIQEFRCSARSHHLRHPRMLVRKCRTLAAKHLSRQIKASHSVLCWNIVVRRMIQILPEEWSQLTCFDARWRVVLEGDQPVLVWNLVTGGYLEVPKRRAPVYRLTTKGHEMLKWWPCRAVPENLSPKLLSIECNPSVHVRKPAWSIRVNQLPSANR